MHPEVISNDFRNHIQFLLAAERNLYLFRSAAVWISEMSRWQGRKAASVDNHKAQKEAFSFIVYKTLLLSRGLYYPHSISLIPKRLSKSCLILSLIFLWSSIFSGICFWRRCYMKKTVLHCEKRMGEALLICKISFAICRYFLVSMFILFKKENINPFLH